MEPVFNAQSSSIDSINQPHNMINLFKILKQIFYLFLVSFFSNNIIF